METRGGSTESPTENFSRTSRRVRNNNKSITRSTESKDQENVNNISLVQNELDITVKDELTKSNTTEAKVHDTTANLNTSTPRRKKDPLANLHSNLSPKYIGFTTPPNQLNSSKEEIKRSLRRRHNNSNNIADVTEDIEADLIFTPNNESTVGFVRRTPRNRDSQITPENSAKRKSFVSPIDKLLIKNGAVMENNNNLPLEDNAENNLKNKEVLMNGEADEIDLCVKESKIHDENAENKENVTIYIEDSDESNEHEKDEDNLSISTEVAKQIDNEDDDEVEGVDKDNDLNLNDNEQHKSHMKEPESSSEEEEPNENIEKSPSKNCAEYDFKENTSNIEECENSLLSQKAEVERTQNDAEGKEAESEVITHTEDNFEEGKEAESEVITHTEDNFEDKNKTIKLLSPNKEALKTTEQNKDDLVKVELDIVESESNNEFTVESSAQANSPSTVSVDSAKGSSIITEGSWMPFSTGDLYWGQIYNYCYWPCIVCPDPNGKTITTEEVGKTGDQTVLVHVRFFADNGRRNWVKRENLLPYNGIKSYQERIVEIREKYGPKSAKYKLHVPTKRKEQVWYEAVKEANIVAEVAYSKRLEKFYEIFEKSKAFHKLEKQRRKSMYISVTSRTSSDIESFYGSNDNINNLSVTALMKQKRERSISPYSPAYSPIKPVAAKRRKLSEDQEMTNKTSSEALDAIAKTEENATNAELNLSQTNSVASTSSNSNSLNDFDIFSGLEFKKFYAVMKDFVMEQNHNEKLEKSLVVAVRNIWALKQLGRRQMERKLRQSLTEGDMSSTLTLVNARPNGVDTSIKRLSSRLKTLMARKSLRTQESHESTPERSVTPKSVTKDASTVEKVKKPINRPILEVIDDIFELDTKYLFKGVSRDPVCKYCYKPGGNLKRCAKNCTYYLHYDCLHRDFNKKIRRGHKSLNGTKTNSDTLNGSNSSSVINLTEVGTQDHVTGDAIAPAEVDVICKECANNEPTKCMVCKCTESKKADDPLVKCSMTQCERAFHPACCKYWPQAKITISKNHIESFRCPSHVCHTCVSDDPKGKFQHLSNAKLTKCVKCPSSFHTDSTCIPAGSQILTAALIICPRHSSTKHDMTVNVNWCFICVGGGQLMCCETCPTAVHAHCLKIPIAANEGYICEECESGRMPLYGEMVWAKFNNFRWWPAIILPPTEIPKNIARKPHNPSDFVVRFFGTHDHGWISRRRVYLYLEGDSSEPPKSKSSLDLSYNKGVEEAKEVYEIIKAKKLQQRNSNENKEKLHPQPYVRIKANRAVPPVKLHVDIESVSKCECDPREENPCGPDTNCLNRVLYHECNPKLCPAGERCQNQMFESRVSPRMDVVYMKERGFGLVSREPIKAGSFIIEYVGEVINDYEFQARMRQKSSDRDENFYFLSVEKDYIIDAGPKGNLARFMNHSCDPNCETQKWSVNSLNRVGLFAIKDIPENTELTFNYHWDDLLGNEKKTCYCGAKNCAGQIGGKIKDLEMPKEAITINGTSKNKPKTKTKPNKRLLQSGLKNKLVSKLKLKEKTKTATKKVAASSALSATTSKAATEESEANEDTSTSRILESPDIFS